MSVKTFIPKDDQELPDSYKATIYYLDGKKDELELAQHRIVDTVIIGQRVEVGPDGTQRVFNVLAPAAAPFLELCTKEDFWNWVPMTSIKRLEFDKDFSKMVAIKEKNFKLAEEKQAKQGKK